MRRIALMGGSFNPVHCGHMNLARAALESGLADDVIFLPTGNPPHKREGLADKLDRLAMVELAVAGQAHMQASREEVDRQGVIYTVDTLMRLRESMPDCRLYYLIGADTLLQLHTWRRPEDVIRLCTFLLAMRPGESGQALEEQLAFWRGKGAEIVLLDAQPMDISSTDVRERARRGQPLAGLVPAEVETYILRHGLYGSGEG